MHEGVCRKLFCVERRWGGGRGGASESRIEGKKRDEMMKGAKKCLFSEKRR